MTEISLENRLKVHEFVAQYAHLCDGGHSQEWAELFLEDAVFSGIPEPLVGRKAFYNRSEELKSRESELRHTITNVYIEPGSSNERARVKAYGVVTDWATVPPEQTMFCIYHYDLVSVAGQWKIAGIHGEFPYRKD